MCLYRVALALGSRGEGRMAKDMNEKSLGRRVCGKQISRSHSNGASLRHATAGVQSSSANRSSILYGVTLPEA